MSSSRKPVRHALVRGLVVVSASMALAACGGSDDDDGAPVPAPVVASNVPPASASSGVDGFIAYLKGLVVTQPETSEPLDVTAFVAPTSETAEFDQSI